MNTSMTTLTTEAVVRMHSAGWFARFAAVVIAEAAKYAEDNDPDVIDIQVPTVTLDNQPLTDGVLRALRRAVDDQLSARGIDMQTAAIEQRVEVDERMLYVVVSIYT